MSESQSFHFGTDWFNNVKSTKPSSGAKRQRITKIVNEKGEVIRETIEQTEDWDETDTQAIDAHKEIEEHYKEIGEHFKAMGQIFQNLTNTFSKLSKTFKDF